jgi:hypothetical protein
MGELGRSSVADMIDYRSYKIDNAGKIVSPALMVRGENIEAVVGTARGLRSDQALEIWDGARRVAAISVDRR